MSKLQDFWDKKVNKALAEDRAKERKNQKPVDEREALARRESYRNAKGTATGERRRLPRNH